MVASIEATEITSCDAECKPMSPQVGKLRRAFPQFVACMIKNLLIFNMGLTIGFPTILIPVLLGFSKQRNPDETLHFTAEQASWYGSTALLIQPVASILSGWMTDKLGRKRAMLLVNIPFISAWLIMSRAQSIAEIYIAGVLLGLAVGLMEASVITFVGEISHQSLRGTLLALSNLFGMLGILSVYMAGSQLLWRNVALLSSAVPVMALFLICLVPETPYWLLTRHRDDEAIKALQWLRGWVPAEGVRTEFDDLKQFVGKSIACRGCKANSAECPHQTGYWRRSLEIGHQGTLRPIIVVFASFGLAHSCGLWPIRPYMVQIWTVYRVPIEPNYLLVLLGFIELIAQFVLLLSVKKFGKRSMFLITTAISACCTMALALNAFYFIPQGVSSFDKEFVLSCSSGEHKNMLALVLFKVAGFTTAMASGIPWMFVSEMFPLRVRAAACGLSAAFCYVSMFVTTKSYLFLERWLSIGGAFMCYFSFAIAAWILVYKILPETEGRTLEEIENHFSDPSNRLTQRDIRTHESSFTRL